MGLAGRLYGRGAGALDCEVCMIWGTVSCSRGGYRGVVGKETGNQLPALW